MNKDNKPIDNGAVIRLVSDAAKEDLGITFDKSLSPETKQSEIAGLFEALETEKGKIKSFNHAYNSDLMFHYHTKRNYEFLRDVYELIYRILNDVDDYEGIEDLVDNFFQPLPTSNQMFARHDFINISSDRERCDDLGIEDGSYYSVFGKSLRDWECSSGELITTLSVKVKHLRDDYSQLRNRPLHQTGLDERVFLSIFRTDSDVMLVPHLEERFPYNKNDKGEPRSYYDFWNETVIRPSGYKPIPEDVKAQGGEA